MAPSYCYSWFSFIHHVNRRFVFQGGQTGRARQGKAETVMERIKGFFYKGIEKRRGKAKQAAKEK